MAASLRDDYGVPAGEDHAGFARRGPAPVLPDPAARPGDGVVRLLFVGGNFARKGGDLLLRWARETQCPRPGNCIW